MPTLAVTDFNIVCAVLGGFVTVFGLVSFLLKENFYLSEACKFGGGFFFVVLSMWIYGGHVFLRKEKFMEMILFSLSVSSLLFLYT